MLTRHQGKRWVLPSHQGQARRLGSTEESTTIQIRYLPVESAEGGCTAICKPCVVSMREHGHRSS